MDRQQVMAFLDSLAAGVDPHDGSPLSVDVLHRADAVLALRTASSLLEADGEKKGRFAAAGTPWTGEEDEQLAHEFDGGRTIAQIALQHGRTSSAITLRLVKLGRIDPATVKRRERSAQVA